MGARPEGGPFYSRSIISSARGVCGFKVAQSCGGFVIVQYLNLYLPGSSVLFACNCR